MPGFFKFIISPILNMLLYGMASYAQMNQTDSLKNLLVNTEQDTNRVLILLELAGKIDRTTPIEALAYYEEALGLSENINYKVGKMRSERGVGICHIFMSDYEIALEHTLIATNLAQEINDYDGIVKGYNNMGGIYIYLERYDEALAIYLEMIDILKDDDKENKLLLYGNLGIIYKKKNKIDSALIYYNKGFSLAEELEIVRSQSIILHNIGTLHETNGDFGDAEKSFEQSIELAEHVNNTSMIAAGWTNLGNVLSQLGNYREAENAIEKGMKIAKQHGLKNILINGHDHLYQHYMRTNNIIKALEHHELYTTKKDSLVTADNNASIAQLQSKFNSEKNKRENDVLKKERELSKAKIRNQRTVIIAIGVCLFISIILVITISRFSAARRRTNDQLKLLNQEILEQKEELIQQATSLQLANEEITNINNNLEKLINERTSEVKKKNDKLIQYSFINAHKLRAPVARIIGLINILKKPKKDENIDEVVKKLEVESKDLDNVVLSINKVLEEETYNTNKGT